MSSVPLTIIIVNWNGCRDTLECLDSLSVANGGPWITTVVDNGSSDDSVVAIRAGYPSSTVLELGKNLGFSGGNNFAISKAIEAGSKYVLLLNNDTVVESTAIQELLVAANSDSSFGLLTPAIRYFDNRSEFWFAGSRIDLARGDAVHDNRHPPDIGEAVREIPWASGCAMLIRREVLEQVGGFDDRFFLNWEDVDLSLRISKRGWKIGLVPSAVIYHKVSRSFAKMWGTGSYYYVRNRLLFTSIHAPYKYRACARVISQHVRRVANAVARRDPDSVASTIVVGRAIMDFILGRFGPIRGQVAGRYNR